MQQSAESMAVKHPPGLQGFSWRIFRQVNRIPFFADKDTERTSSMKTYLNRLFTEKKLVILLGWLTLFLAEALIMPSPVQDPPGGSKSHGLQDKINYRVGVNIPYGASPFKNMVLRPISVVDELFPENVSQQTTFNGQKQGDEQNAGVPQRSSKFHRVWPFNFHRPILTWEGKETTFPDAPGSII